MPAERSRLLRIGDLQRHAVVPDTGAAGDGQILPLGKADGLPVVEGDILLQYIAGQIQQEAVQVTRFLPFLLFPAGKPTPKFIQYLGRVLPFAVIGLLVIYCLKGVSVTAFPFGLPELIAIILVAVLHYWKSNMLLSIGCGTVVYMLMVQFLFAA